MTNKERANSIYHHGACQHIISGACPDCVAAAIDSAVAEERERCAKIADGLKKLNLGEGFSATKDRIAAAIRGGKNE